MPNWLKTLAVDWFGTNDRIGLLMGIASILTADAAVVGILALGRQICWTMAGIALFGLVGAYAWEATPGRHTIRVRATERNGPIQTAERVEPFPSGATGQHQIVVIVQ